MYENETINFVGFFSVICGSISYTFMSLTTTLYPLNNHQVCTHSQEESKKVLCEGAKKNKKKELKDFMFECLR